MAGGIVFIENRGGEVSEEEAEIPTKIAIKACIKITSPGHFDILRGWMVLGSTFLSDVPLARSSILTAESDVTSVTSLSDILHRVRHHCHAQVLSGTRL